MMGYLGKGDGYGQEPASKGEIIFWVVIVAGMIAFLVWRSL